MINIHTLFTAVHGSPMSAIQDAEITGVSIDTRTIQQGQCYFAIRGKTHNGHAFIDDAYRKGARACIVDHVFLSDMLLGKEDELSRMRKELPNLIVVQDTVQSLGYVARSIREDFSGTCIGITGSCGKTTTKEMVNLLLGRHAPVLKNSSNYNNHIGLPLTIMELTDQYDYIVCEMGANAKGDIAYLANILKPQVGIITNVHPAHLEGFKDIEHVYHTKLELAEYLDSVNGVLIVNGDDDKLLHEVQKFDVTCITFGQKQSCDFVVDGIHHDADMITFRVNGVYTFRLKSYAKMNVYNALAAITLADYCGMQLSELTNVFSLFEDMKGRFRVRKGDVLVIDDTYNANPAAFLESLMLFKKMKIPGKKIIVCGDMFELGKESKRFHMELGKNIAATDVHTVIGLGKEIRYTIEAIKTCGLDITCYHCESHDEALTFIKKCVRKGDAVFLKASRGMKLDELADAI